MLTSGTPQAIWIKTPPGAVYPSAPQLLNIAYIAKVGLHDTILTRIVIRFPVGAGLGQTEKIDFASPTDASDFLVVIENAIRASGIVCEQ